ncbi:hypothetical protein [Shinella sp.]|jgi:hypothetical protein|uniref:hypothetical protein n=1 Tax=Shinella sp. TaxID=1870904 RepID=UPI003F70AD88
MGGLFSSAKGIAFATAAGLLIFLQFTMLTAALDIITSLLLVAVGFLAGRFSK